MIEFTLNAPTPSLNQTLKMHPQVKRRHRANWAWEIAGSVLGSRPREPWQRARVTIWRHSVGTLDEDNAIGGAKGLLDVLKPMHPTRNPCGLGIIADDSPAHLELVVHQVKETERTGHKTVVRVEEI